ncbi:hypothetical protein B0H13DRAFT_2312931 [Mycena leptocephala]|nr:hypothetical protein B0H13DRAFT_2312931 [Mycena leptocephala]
MSVNSEQASLKIKFIIVGGGLAGLACGYALRVSGHDMVVVDQHDMQEKTEGSVRCPPNMTRTLSRWPDMALFLETHATQCTG